jgi:hypothetical protein
MAELVDAPASGAGAGNGVEVRVLFRAPFLARTFVSIATASLTENHIFSRRIYGRSLESNKVPFMSKGIDPLPTSWFSAFAGDADDVSGLR